MFFWLPLRFIQFFNLDEIWVIFGNPIHLILTDLGDLITLLNVQDLRLDMVTWHDLGDLLEMRIMKIIPHNAIQPWIIDSYDWPIQGVDSNFVIFMSCYDITIVEGCEYGLFQ